MKPTDNISEASQSQDTQILYGGVTPEQLAKWKTQYGETYTVEFVADGDKPAMGAYFRKIDRGTISYVMHCSDFVDKQVAIVDNLWLGGDEAIKTDDRYLFGAANALQELMSYRVATLKKN